MTRDHTLIFAAVTVMLPACGLAQPCGTPWMQWTGTSPPARWNHTLGYDSARARVILFSGAPSALTDTWEWDGSGPGSWTLRSSTGPIARSFAAMAFDSARARMVLFGGQGQGSALQSETWEWDGAAGQWTQRQVAGPIGRWQHAMAYDTVRAKTILFGGVRLEQAQYQYLTDTWEWNGTAWSQVSVGSPMNRALGMVYDPVRARAVLIASESTPPYHRGVWEWDGAQWTERLIGGLPDNIMGAASYDPIRARTVVIGDVDDHYSVPLPQVLTETWEWDSAAGTWALRTSTGPRPPSGHPVISAFDGSRIMAFGIPANPQQPGAQTWLYDGTVSAGPTLTAIAGDAPQTMDPGATISFHAAGVGAVSYQWRRYGVPLADGGNISGAASPTLTINPVSPGSTGLYDVLVSNACGTTTRTPVSLIVPCYPNCDSSVAAPFLNANDFQCYLGRYAIGCETNPCYANCDNSTAPPILNANDFQCYLNKFAAGCT